MYETVVAVFHALWCEVLGWCGLLGVGEASIALLQCAQPGFLQLHRGELFVDAIVGGGGVCAEAAAG